MAVRLRLMRFGKRSRPSYRLCVVDSRAPRDGAYIESLGFYDPFVEDDRKKIRVDRERAEYWLGVGAQPSETVASFLRSLNVAGIVRPPKRRKKRTRKVRKATAGKTAAKQPEAKKTTKKTTAKKKAKKD